MGRGPDIQTLQTSCCVVGGGPAGMMLGFLLARQGVDVTVLEKHANFIDDFRGDMIHPATMEAIHALGLLEEFLRLPHQRTHEFAADFGDVRTPLADFSRIKSIAPFIAFMPQKEFLAFLAAQARKHHTFRLLMGTQAAGLIEQGGRTTGVLVRSDRGEFKIEARVTIGADGRGSRIREWARLPLKEIGSPIDVFWMRVPRGDGCPETSLRIVRPGRILSVIDRGDYFQCAYVIPKGDADTVRAGGIERFRRELAALAPVLSDGFASLRSWDDVKLLSVSVNRLKKWSKPGLICIGDAAHAMSPVSGVGVNLAIQDAIAAANALGPAFLNGASLDNQLARIERRRKSPSILTQMMQGAFERGPIRSVMKTRGALKTPMAIALLKACPWLQVRVAEIIGLGVRPETIRDTGATIKEKA